MRKIIVFQHVAQSILGTLNPTLKQRKLNIRYINFNRMPEHQPSIERYHGLIVLGGHMGVYEAEKYNHLYTELQLIEQALKRQIPILGICLGAQLLAHVLGSPVTKAPQMEIGWCDIEFLPEAQTDSLFQHFPKQQKLFQIHGDTFQIPKTATQLAKSQTCNSQAFRYGENAYGLQFHLEVDQPMIERWLNNEQNQEHMFKNHPEFSQQQIIQDTETYLQQSTDLSQKTFNQFINLFHDKPANTTLSSKW